MTVEAALRLPGHARSVPVARRHVTEALENLGVAKDTIDTVALLATEVATNAVIHAGGEFTVTVVVDGGIWVAVRDSSHRRPTHRQHDEESLMGRGLELVEMLADRQGIEYHPDGGKSVWFALGAAATPEDRSWLEEAPESRVEFVLLNLPTGLYDVMRAYNEALLREYVISQIGGAAASESAGTVDISVADRVRSSIAEEFHRLIRAAGEPAPANVDVRVSLPAADAAAAAQTLGPTLIRAEQMAERGKLLTPTAPAEVRTLRAWFVDQVERQAHGQPAVAWQGLPDNDEAVPISPERLQRAAKLTSRHSHAIVADRSDRIIGATPAVAEVLGWTVAELLGHPLTRIMPPEFRNAHIAGFARQVLTGDNRIIGTDVRLQAWHRRGHGVPASLFIERHVYPDEVLFLGILTFTDQMPS